MNILGKNIALTLAVGGISLVGIIQADASGLGTTDFKVTADVLNVRTEPGTNGTVVKKLKRGTIVTPTELSENKSWGKIGKNQWVSMNYLLMIDNSTIPDNGESYTDLNNVKYVVTANSLNVRREPSTKSSIVGTFKNGTKIHATKQKGEWIFVEDGHIDGWVHSDYTKKVSDNQDNNKPTEEFKEETVSMRELEVTANSLNVRQKPSTNSSIVGQMKKGETDMTNVKSGEWYKVTNGWIHSDYVKETIWSLGSNETPEGSPDAPTGEVSMERIVANVPNGDVLNVRYSKVLSGSVKDTLNNDDSVTLINDVNGVSYIKYLNKHGRLEFGYVASRYLSLK